MGKKKNIYYTFPLKPVLFSRRDISCKHIAVKGDLNVSEPDKYVANHHSKYVIGIFRFFFDKVTGGRISIF